jgi:hypothetical protein
VGRPGIPYFLLANRSNPEEISVTPDPAGGFAMHVCKAYERIYSKRVGKKKFTAANTRRTSLKIQRRWK